MGSLANIDISSPNSMGICAEIHPIEETDLYFVRFMFINHGLLMESGPVPFHEALNIKRRLIALEPSIH